MSLLSVIKGLFKPQQFLINKLVIDVMVRETVSSAWDFTDRPTEKDQKISDHRRKRPTSVNLEIVFTDDEPALSGAAIMSLVDGVQTAEAKGKALLKLLDTADKITLTLPSGVYESYAPQNHDRTIDSTTSGAWFCNLSFKEIRFVETATEEVSLSAADLKNAESGTDGTANSKTKKKGATKSNAQPKKMSTGDELALINKAGFGSGVGQG